MMDPETEHSLTSPTCLGVADSVPEESGYHCRNCGASTKVPKTPVKIG